MQSNDVVKTEIPISKSWTVVRPLVSFSNFVTTFNGPREISFLIPCSSSVSLETLTRLTRLGDVSPADYSHFSDRDRDEYFFRQVATELGKYYTVLTAISIELSTLKVSGRCRDSRNSNCGISRNLLVAGRNSPADRTHW